MVRLHLIVEGQTEEAFVRLVLQPHLARFGVFTDARRSLTSYDHGRAYRGGVVSYARVKRDLTAWLRQDRHAEVRFSTMFDLFRLPTEFPGVEEARRVNPPSDRVTLLERRFGEDIGDARFVPHLQLHEFEALVMVDPGGLRKQFEGVERAVKGLELLVASVSSPELINDDDPPSKRIIAAIPKYLGRKAIVGPQVTREIGLGVLRDRCPHFGSWLSALEALAGEGTA